MASSLHLPTGFDPSKILEFLSSLPEEEQAQVLEGAMGQVNELQARAQQSRTQEGMVRRFKDMRAKFLRAGGIFSDELASGQLSLDAVQMSFSNMDAKPSTNIPSLRSLKPMIVAELEIGTTHRGRYLCGWVAVDDAFFGIASTSLLLEDVTGQLVEVAAYGLVDTKLPARERQRRVAALFPKGKPVIVYEPYYKVRQDMSEGIRVEKPHEMVALADAPTDLNSWKKLGNDHFSALNSMNNGRGALACYQRALKTVEIDVRAVAVLLNNLATCRSKTRDFVVAIQLAGAAVHLDPTYLKGWFRLASSLMEDETDRQGAGDRCSGAIASRVVAHALEVIPNLTATQRRMLEDVLSNKESYESESTQSSCFRSYAGWSVALESPAFVLPTQHISEGSDDKGSTATTSADAWREKGSQSFAAGDFRTAEECYRAAVAARASCCRNVALVLNNISAVHLMLHRDASGIVGISDGGAKISSTNPSAQIPNIELALLNCSVAGIVDPLNGKAWVRRARCLQKLGFTPEECIGDLHTIQASVVAKAGVGTEQLQELKRCLSSEIQRLSRQCTTAKGVQKVSKVPTDVQREERDAQNLHHSKTAAKEGVASEVLNSDEESIDAYIARMEAFEAMTRFGFGSSKSMSKRQRDNLPRELKMFVSSHPPQIHIEFPKLRGWPEGIDPTFARKVLHRAYLDASANPWIMAMSMRDGTFHTTITPADILKRWHGTGAMHILSEKTDLRYGDIIDGREELEDAVPAYDARIRSNFANNPNRSEVYFFGTTHVAIGFNDFSSLLCASLRDKSPAAVGPLRFVGFEMSEFSIAKCKIVAQMLGSAEVAITSVMEVWLSSTWSETTLREFRRGLSCVLASMSDRDENPKVLSYLRHWASVETISAAKARSEFFGNLERYNQKQLPSVCCFRREVDRLDLAQYMLTGEIRASPHVVSLVETEISGASDAAEGHEGGASASKKKRARKKKAKQAAAASVSPLVGSLTMWNVPPGAPPLEEDIAFNTVDFMSLLEEYSRREKTKRGSAERLSIVDLFEIHIMQHLHRLRSLMVANKLTIDVMYGVAKAVRPETAGDEENRELLARIAAMQPYTISWSNLLDYFLPDDFHDLARRCSVHGDCVHYGYSMNWPTQVYGTNIIDFDPETDKEFIAMTLDAVLGFPNENGSSSVDGFKAMGLDKLLLLPFRDHPINGTGYVLAQAFKDRWVEHFMAKGRLTTRAKTRLGSQCTPTNSELQRGAMDMAVPSPLYRTSLTMYLSWCYDPELRLQPAQNPFEIGAATDKDMLADLFKHMSAEDKQQFWDDIQAGR